MRRQLTSQELSPLGDGPSEPEKERDRAIAIASRLLDEPMADPDDDQRVLARQLMRALERATREPPAARRCNHAFDVLVITTTYEIGFGHGQQKDRLANPYSEGSHEHHAYSMGYEEGERRAAQPPGARLPTHIEAAQMALAWVRQHIKDGKPELALQNLHIAESNLRGAVPPPETGPVAPIMKVTILDGIVALAEFYTPGLPDGEHDLFPVPLNPNGQLEPFLRAPQPPRTERPKHARRVVGHASGWQEQMDTCVCGNKWPCEGSPRSAGARMKTPGAERDPMSMDKNNVLRVSAQLRPQFRAQLTLLERIELCGLWALTDGIEQGYDDVDLTAMFDCMKEQMLKQAPVARAGKVIADKLKGSPPAGHA